MAVAASPAQSALLGARLAACGAATPDRVAVEDEAGVVSLGELLRRADAVAQALLAEGAGAERTVAVRVRRDRGLLVALLAVVRSGAAFVPVDPTDPPRRQQQIVRDSQARLVLSSTTTPPGPDFGVTTLPVESCPVLPSRARLPEIHPNQLAYVIYTSGSTGSPKGVAVPHRALASYLDWAAATYACPGAALVHTSPAFDLTLTTLFVPLLNGGSVRLLAQDQPEQLAATLAERRWGLLKLTPSHLDLLGLLWASQGTEPPEVAVVVVGGEALWHRQLTPWLRAARPPRVFNEYGPTEATVGCCIHEVGADDPEAVPIGAPVPYASGIVLTAEGPVASGEAGELLVGGIGLARGYRGRSGLTAERFIPDPQTPGGRRYRTGDLVSRGTDGQLRYQGRVDRQLKVRGHRVEPGEVEAVLRSAPGVQGVAVCGVGNGDRTRLVAYLVSGVDAPIDLAVVRRHADTRLPAYAVPGRFVVVPGLPITLNGKVDHRRLAAGAHEVALLEELEAMSEELAERLVHRRQGT